MPDSPIDTLPSVIAHRGASGYRPEHTRAAYELAVEQGADAVEPDIVATSDGVLVVRHENEISGTTDIASRAEFASRRTSKRIDGRLRTGWFTEDFTWAELSSLRATERLPTVRPGNAAFDAIEPILRLRDLAELAAATGIRMVAEIKHAGYFASIGLPLDDLFASEMGDWGGDLVVESFERGVLGLIRERGIEAPLVFLAEARGDVADLAGLADSVDGVSVDKAILHADPGLVARAHDAGLEVYTWTLRPENRFLPTAYRDGAPEQYGRWREEFAAIMATGVDAVFADHPDLAIEVRDRLQVE